LKVLKIIFFRSYKKFVDLENNLCLPSIKKSQWKRYSDDGIIPPYYNPNNQLYPYGISKPALPLYKGDKSKEASPSKKLGT